MYIKRAVRDTCRRNRNFGRAAGETGQKKHRGVPWSSLALDPSPDDRIDRRANGQTDEKEKDGSPDEGPEDHV